MQYSGSGWVPVPIVIPLGLPHPQPRAARSKLGTPRNPGHPAHSLARLRADLAEFVGPAFSMFAPIRPYNRTDPEVTVLRKLFFLASFAVAICASVPSCAQQVPQEKPSQKKEQVLW